MFLFSFLFFVCVYSFVFCLQIVAFYLMLDKNKTNQQKKKT